MDLLAFRFWYYVPVNSKCVRCWNNPLFPSAVPSRNSFHVTFPTINSFTSSFLRTVTNDKKVRHVFCLPWNSKIWIFAETLSCAHAIEIEKFIPVFVEFSFFCDATLVV